MTHNKKQKKATRRGRNAALALSFVLFVSLFYACTTENYDSGDGKYSYLRAEFVMAYINAEGAIDYAIDDNDQRINLDKTLKPTWTTTKDSTYRALLYYNDKPEGAEAVRLSMVYVLEPRDTSKLKETSFDPVEFESSWLSANNRFLNFSFFVKTGQVDDDSRQAIGILSSTDDDGTPLLTLLHDQGGIPQYYSTRVYASIPLSEEMRQQSFRLKVHSYAGLVVKDYPAPAIVH